MEKSGPAPRQNTADLSTPLRSARDDKGVLIDTNLLIRTLTFNPSDLRRYSGIEVIDPAEVNA